MAPSAKVSLSFGNPTFCPMWVIFTRKFNIFHIFRDKNKRFIQWNFFHVTSAPQKLLMQAFPLSVQNHLVSSCHFQRHACFPKNTKYVWFFRQNTSRTTCISHFPFLQNHNKDFQLSDPVICWSWQLQIWSNFFHTLTHLQFYLQYLPPKNVCKILKQIRKKKLEHCCVIPDKVKLASTGRIAPVCSGGWERVQAISLEGNIFSSGSENRTQG